MRKSVRIVSQSGGILTRTSISTAKNKTIVKRLMSICTGSSELRISNEYIEMGLSKLRMAMSAPASIYQNIIETNVEETKSRVLFLEYYSVAVQLMFPFKLWHCVSQVHIFFVLTICLNDTAKYIRDEILNVSTPQTVNRKCQYEWNISDVKLGTKSILEISSYIIVLGIILRIRESCGCAIIINKQFRNRLQWEIPVTYRWNIIPRIYLPIKANSSR